MNKKLKIIAEAAQGYEGNYFLAKKLMQAAIKANCDAIKYQLVYADELCTEDYKHYKLFKSLELKDDNWRSLKDLSKEYNIELQFDIFGNKSLDLSEKLNIKTVKIHPTDISNNGLLDRLSKSKIKNIILGIGGANLYEIKKVLKIFKKKNLILMLGFQNYPTPTNKNNLSRYDIIKKFLNNQNHNSIQIGFADHEPFNSPLKYLVPATAIGKGFNIIEKHITLKLDRKLEDFETALFPDEFKLFCKQMRECFSSIGFSNHQPFFGMSREEINYRNNVRKHVVANKNLSKNKKISLKDVSLKRSSQKNYITDINEVIGKKLKIDLSSGAVIKKINLLK